MEGTGTVIQIPRNGGWSLPLVIIFQSFARGPAKAIDNPRTELLLKSSDRNSLRVRDYHVILASETPFFDALLLQSGGSIYTFAPSGAARSDTRRPKGNEA